MASLYDFKLLNEQQENGETVLTFGASKEIIDQLKECYGDDYESKLQDYLTAKFKSFTEFLQSLSPQDVSSVNSEEKLLEAFEEFENKKSD